MCILQIYTFFLLFFVFSGGFENFIPN